MSLGKQGFSLGHFETTKLKNKLVLALLTIAAEPKRPRARISNLAVNSKLNSLERITCITQEMYITKQI